ncbi:MAG TPA: hypothetical protein DHV21_03415 [Curvibacter sp.]|nr:hypothetical protein [Curvibacter sp.]
MPGLPDLGQLPGSTRRRTMNTPKLRALRVAPLPPLQGATPAARRSRFRGVPRLGPLARKH